MTSLAFILGVLPLAISTGAGAGARQSVGTGVMGGMLAATFLAIFFVPWFFRLIFDRKISEPRTKDELHAEIDHAHALHERPPVATPGHPPHRDPLHRGTRRIPVMETSMRKKRRCVDRSPARSPAAPSPSPQPPELDLARTHGERRAERDARTLVDSRSTTRC